MEISIYLKDALDGKTIHFSRDVRERTKGFFRIVRHGAYDYNELCYLYYKL